ncbi:MAG: GNAT family N-acetyltransferase [Proteobacteria bacterium]|nr:GNAT family N-acetyltransferase [Pseudomonadota bacterium]
MTIRLAEPADASDWLNLRDALWPGSFSDHAAEVAAYFVASPSSPICLLADHSDDGVIGFAEIGLRAYAEGCATSPVGYIEGIFVHPEYRQDAVGRALVAAAEVWAIEQGCTEMASDRQLGNQSSGSFHEALGFEEAERLVCYRKSLS